MIDVERGDVIQGAKVKHRYNSSLGGVETATLEIPSHGDERRVINEMAQMGWTYHFTRDSVGKMWFRESDDWTMEEGVGNK